jgi:hypothetical protein
MGWLIAIPFCFVPERFISRPVFRASLACADVCAPDLAKRISDRKNGGLVHSPHDIFTKSGQFAH